jgi:hypothetical protein
MGESRQRPSRPSSENIRTSVPRDLAKDLPVNLARARSSKFGLVVCALWPVKPALNLAQRSGISERMAQYIIDGERKPNVRAALAVYAEIID